jgi:predicted MFS family arabinose efflux permease
MRWVMLAVLFLARLCLALTFQGLAAVAPFLGPELGLDHAAIGGLISIYWLPGMVLALPAGALANRFGAKRLAIASLMLVALGSVVLALSGGYASAAAARLVCGAGSALLSVLVSTMVADWFQGRELSTALAIVLDSWIVGLAVTLAAFPLLAEMTSWRVVIGVTAACCVAAALLLATSYRAPPTSGARAPAAPSLAGIAHALRRQSLMPTLAALVWTAYNAGLLIILTYAPPMLAAIGLTLADAGLAVSLIAWVSVASVPVGGWLADRRGGLGPTIALGGAGAAAACAALALGAPPFLMSVLAGLCVGLPVGGIMSLPARSAAPGHVAWSMGWFMTVYYLGLALAQALAGIVREASDSPRVTVLLGCGFLLAAALGILPFQALQHARRRSAPC